MVTPFKPRFDEFLAPEKERDRVRLEAVGRGIDQGIEGAIGRGLDAAHFDTLGRESLTRFVMRLVEILEDRAKGDLPDLRIEDGRLAFAEDIADYLAESPLYAKLLAAYYVEEDVTDGVPIPNGVVGRAVDRAMAEILPYATASPGAGWYNNDVAPKL